MHVNTTCAKDLLGHQMCTSVFLRQVFMKVWSCVESNAAFKIQRLANVHTPIPPPKKVGTLNKNRM